MAWITKEKRIAIYLRDGFMCLFCGRDLHAARPREITLDHLLPRSKGGSNRASNLVVACRSCNSSKQAVRWTVFAKNKATIRRITNHRRRKLNINLARSIVRAAKSSKRPAAGKKATQAHARG